jgi:biotin carboxyl carrier protein
MDIKVDNLETVFQSSIVKIDRDNNLILRINNIDHNLKLVNFKSNILEFIFDNSYYEIRILDITNTEIFVLINGSPLTLKKHSILTDIIEKSSKRGGGSGQSALNSISSQIPGRVISISINKGDSIKKGDSIIVLESMKMQVAIKSPRDGIIKELRVKEGQSISRNDIVATLG